ncbi:MAG TPA: hypothetical protein VMR90_06850 [Candidatus Cybelea sp.]|nr:hypothetical protein [Candidatus Cybelea sp.]
MNSSQITLDVLAARVEKLEVSIRRWRFLSAVLLLSGLSVFLMGAKPADRIEPNVIRASSFEAQEFILKDETGHVYARLSLKPSLPKINQKGRTYLFPGDTFPGGEAALQFYDEKGDVLWTAPSTGGAQFLPAR